MKLLILYYLIINILALLLYGMDKRKAQKHQYRIQEKTLLIIAFLGGALGALIGMTLFHHKTKHMKFILFNPIFLCIHIGIILYIIKGSL